MRYILPSFILSCGVVFAASATPAKPLQPAKKEAPVSTPAKSSRVNLYETPYLNAKVIGTVSAGQRLIRIFRKGRWIKVGDPSNGATGWINRRQYRRARRNLSSSHSQTVFIRTENMKNGKSEVDIVAYRNGKKLSDKEAQALYNKMRKAAQREMHNIDRMNLRMDRFFEHENRMLDEVDNSPWAVGSTPSAARPVIVINRASGLL